MGKKYTIGQMAEICNISINLLRYYDTNNVLKPAYRNSKTKYRYYIEEQIEEIILLYELKKLNFPLKSIAEMIAGRELNVLQERLEIRMTELRRSINETQAVYDQTVDILLRVAQGLRTSDTEKDMAGQKIEIVNFPERNIVFTREISYCNAAVLFISRRAELHRLIEDNNLSAYGPNMAIFHSDYLKQFSADTKDHESDLEVCYSVRDKYTDTAICRRFGGFNAVSALHIGHYKYMRPKYIEMRVWAAEQGIGLNGISVEEYIVGASMTKCADDYVTRLYLPISE